MSPPANFNSNAAAFFGGVKSALLSLFFLVLIGTYIGIGALAHDFGFSSWWLVLSTMLVWAAPAQVILISALGTGATLFEVAIAVSLSGDAAVADGGRIAAAAARASARGCAICCCRRISPPSACGWSRSGCCRQLPRRVAHRFLQRTCRRLHGDGDDIRLCRLLSCRRVAAAVCGSAAVPHADVVPDVDRAQCRACMVDRLALVLGLVARAAADLPACRVST